MLPVPFTVAQGCGLQVRLKPRTGKREDTGRKPFSLSLVSTVELGMHEGLKPCCQKCKGFEALQICKCLEPCLPASVCLKLLLWDLGQTVMSGSEHARLFEYNLTEICNEVELQTQLALLIAQPLGCSRPSLPAKR